MAKVAFTGGPGVGKTTLLAALQDLGYTVVKEAAREVIAERLAQGLIPRPPPLDFAREVVRRDLVAYEVHRARKDWVLFDRGLIDSLGSLYETGDADESQVRATLSANPFERFGFILPPWREIYRTDSERDQSFEDCLRIHDRLVRWYKRWGVRLHEVPRAPVEARVAFVINALASGGA